MSFSDTGRQSLLSPFENIMEFIILGNKGK